MFPGPTLLTAITAIIERALNHALELDPAGQKSLLDALEGPVQFRITDPMALTCSLHRVGSRVQVHGQPTDNPALNISGKPLAFAALATGTAVYSRIIASMSPTIPHWRTSFNVLWTSSTQTGKQPWRSTSVMYQPILSANVFATQWPGAVRHSQH